jgi:protein O-mannosyl-transferase
MNKFNTTVFWCICLILCSFVLFQGIWHIPLLFDDVATITNNPTIRELSKLYTIFALPHDIVLAWRPIANLTFALSYAVSGLDPWAHHGFGLIIHTLTSIVLFKLVKLTLETEVMKRWKDHASTIAGSVALIWLVHPVQSETVIYISQRTESLMGLFYLITLYCFIKGSKSNSKLWYLLSYISMFLGILSKEVIATAPLTIWLYDRTFISGSFKESLKKHDYIFALLALNWIVLLILFQDLETQAVGYTTAISWFKYAITETKAVYTYIQLIVYPHPLIFDRGPVFLDSFQAALPYVIFALGLIIITLWALLKRPLLGFSLAWFCIILAPTTTIIPIAEEPIAENRLYLPSISLIALIVIGLYSSLNSKYSKITCTIISIALAVTTLIRINDYKSGYEIWSHTLQYAPNNPRAHNNLGLMWEKEKLNPNEAIKEYEKAIQLDPNYAEAHNNFAILISKIPGNEDLAIEHYKAALKIKPNFAEIHNNLALLLSHKKGSENEACIHYMQAIKNKPFNADIYSNYADLLGRIGRKAEAIKQCQKALEIEPMHIASLNNMAILLAETGHSIEAESYYRKLLKINPSASLTWYNLANLLATNKGHESEAVKCFESALHTNPDFAEAHYNLANLLSETQDQENEAIKHYKEAIRINPNYIGAHNNLAILLSKHPDYYTEAAYHYECALKLMPDSYAINFNLAMLLFRIPGRGLDAKKHLSETIKLNPSFKPALEAYKKLNK